VLAGLVVGAPGVASAQMSTSCADSAQSQAALNACAVDGARAADQQLKQSYDDLTRYLDPVSKDRLAAAEKAWIAYRNADCGFWGASAASLSKMNYENCLAQLTTARAKELDSWPPNASRDSLIPQN
jgi:uncharacterized protein YecT (DUF1311 family)